MAREGGGTPPQPGGPLPPLGGPLSPLGGPLSRPGRPLPRAGGTLYLPGGPLSPRGGPFPPPGGPLSPADRASWENDLKTPHLLRVDDAPGRFAPLIDAARALGLRIGWLDLGGATTPVPEALETAAALSVLRAVAVGEGRTVTVKPMRGAPVLKDLLREHFRGCVMVLVRGARGRRLDRGAPRSRLAALCNGRARHGAAQAAAVGGCGGLRGGARLATPPPFCHNAASFQGPLPGPSERRGVP